jgi:hypothetical protein
LTVFFTVHVFAFVSGTVRPSFNAFAVLLILEPVPYVDSSICMFVFTITMSFVMTPLSGVNVSISMQ